MEAARKVKKHRLGQFRADCAESNSRQRNEVTVVHNRRGIPTHVPVVCHGLIVFNSVNDLGFATILGRGVKALDNLHNVVVGKKKTPMPLHRQAQVRAFWFFAFPQSGPHRRHSGCGLFGTIRGSSVFVRNLARRTLDVQIHPLNKRQPRVAKAGHAGLDARQRVRGSGGGGACLGGGGGGGGGGGDIRLQVKPRVHGRGVFPLCCRRAVTLGNIEHGQELVIWYFSDQIRPQPRNVHGHDPLGILDRRAKGFFVMFLHVLAHVQQSVAKLEQVGDPSTTH